MTDAFAEFGFERRPWLEPPAIQSRYHELAVSRHPDACGGDPSPLSRLNEARAILSSHASRLRHLLSLVPDSETPTSHFEPDFELFSSVGMLAGQAEALSLKRDRALSPLTATVLAAQAKLLEKDIGAALERSNRLAHALEEKILALDSRWPDVPAQELLLLAEEATFSQRWQQSLRDARTRLLGG